MIISCISCDMIVRDIAPIYMHEEHRHIPCVYEVVRLYGLLCTLLSGYRAEESELFCNLNAPQPVSCVDVEVGMNCHFHIYVIALNSMSL